MEILLITDIHGRPLNQLDPVLEDLEPDRIFCLGDFDRTRTMHELREMREDYDMEIVPGNHEHSIYHGKPITSGAMRSQGVTYNKLYQDLQNDIWCKQFVEDLLENHRREFYLDKDSYGEDYHTLLLHGALDGSLMSNPSASGKEAELWYRLLERPDHERNFDAMEEAGFDLLIRGHDARPEFAIMDPDEGLDVMKGTEHKLYPYCKHTITVGDYYEGHYAVLDTSGEYPVVRFETI